MKDDFSATKTELYHAFLAAWSFNRKLHRLPERLNTESREFLLEEFTSIRSLANEVVLRLCNLDDDTSRVSFREIRRLLNKDKNNLDRSFKDSVNKSTDSYRQAVNALKIKHRNLYIAHLNGENYPDPITLGEMGSVVAAPLTHALETLSVIWGARQGFSFKLGSYEGTVDFVSEVLGPRYAVSSRAK